MTTTKPEMNFPGAPKSARADDAHYDALRSRDARFDGRFFVGVVTTGIYCRPICPARTPKRANVRFFACAAAAADAGFRACRRCRPETAPGTPAWLGSSATVARALRLIEAGEVNDASLVDLAERLGITDRHLRRLFADHLGTSPISFARTHRIHLARQLIDQTDLSMTTIAAAAGFASLRNFNDCVRAGFGASPTELRRARHHSVAATTLRLRLPYRPPLAWHELLEFFAHRAIDGVEAVVDRSYRRAIELDGVAGVIEVSRHPREDVIEVRIPAAYAPSTGTVLARVRRLFDLGADPARLLADLGSDAVLGPRFARHPGRRVPGGWDAFEIAVRAVVGQQVSVAGARTVLGRIVARCGRELPSGDGTLVRVFPTPSQLADANLDGVGMPGARIATVQRLARAVADGALHFDRDPDEVQRRLCALPGIGEWTAQYVALRGLGEPDAFLPGDLGVRRALAEGGRLPSVREVVARAEAWRPWRAYAVLHLWLGT